MSQRDIAIRRFGPTAWSLEPHDLPMDARDRAGALAALATDLGEARDAVVGSRSVLLLGAEPPREIVDALRLRAPAASIGESHVIPVVYDGPDLESVAETAGISVEEVIERHAGETYCAVLCGFLPGFAYLTQTPAKLRVPRRSAPRPKVGPRSVGLAGPYTGIYPSASPGGWNLLGEALRDDLFDPRRPRPPLVNLLDRVRFERAERRDVETPQPGAVTDASASGEPRGDAELLVTRLSGLATLVDRGRLAHRRFGVPTGGAQDRESYAELAAACGLETLLELVAGAIELTVARGATWLASNGEPAKHMREGDSIRFEARSSLTRLIAMGGEPRVDPVLGSRSTLVGFAWAGPLGRPLARGDRLSIDDVAPMPSSVPRAIDSHAEVADLPFEPLGDAADLASHALEIDATSGRVGTRLVSRKGAATRRTAVATGESHPMVPGAVQETPDGTLIVLGPDSATLGGYPLVGFLTEQARSALARLRPGRRVRLKV